jgi:hypothetical protein
MTYSELRASDAERERVVAFLREHALLGRLSDDELEERIGLAYASKTVGDLERLIADLPRAASRPPAPRPSYQRPVRRREGPPKALIGLGLGALLLSGIPFALLAVVAAVGIAVLATVFALSMVLGPFLLVALLVLAVVRRHGHHHRHRGQMRWQY